MLDPGDGTRVESMSEGVFELSNELASRTRRRRLKAVVLAGGKGTRLAPYTSVLPKPLMPIGDRSILELVVNQLATCGITDVTLCVGYLSHLIEAVLDNRARRRRRDHVRARAGGARHGRAASARRGPRPNVHRDERRRPHDARLRRVRSAPPAESQPRSRSRRTSDGSRSTTASSISARTGERTRSRLRREAGDDLDRQHGDLRDRAGGAAAHPAERLLRLPGSRPRASQGGESVGAYRYDGLWFDIGRRDDYEKAARRPG